jgi:osmotically inducible protein OsmC
MDRNASAIWHGDLKTGTGTITTQSHTLDNTQYSFKSRFEEGTGTNPEELIAAAHAGCFTMALSAQLSSAEFPPTTLETTAVVTLETTEDGPTVTKIHLTTKASVPGIDDDKFAELAKKAKEGCPISRLLKAAEITLDATLL